MKLSFCAIGVLIATAAAGALAATVPCPDLAAAVQVAACPSEEELSFTFTGFCSDNARMYRQDADVCRDYQRYRALKNLALWESRDGVFQAYVSCDLPVAGVKAMRASGIAVAKKGEITSLVCTYGPGVVFTNRTREACKVDVKADCAADADSCRATCE